MKTTRGRQPKYKNRWNYYKKGYREGYKDGQKATRLFYEKLIEKNFIKKEDYERPS